MRFLLLYTFIFLISLSAEAQFTTTETIDFPAEARDDAVAFSMGEYLYTGTGLTNFFYVINDWWRFHYPTKTWQKLDDLPFEARQYSMGFTHGKFIYLFGGYAARDTYFNDFWRFDTEGLTWKKLDTLPGSARWSGFAFTAGDYGYVGGGDDTTRVHKDFYRYSFTSEKWEQLPDLPFGRRMHGIAASNGINAVVGLGTSGVQEAYKDLYIFNGATQEFTKFMDFPKALQRVKSVWRKEKGADILYLFGGQEIGGKYGQKLYKLNLKTLQIDSAEITDVTTRRSMNFTNYRDGMALIFGLTNENRFIQTLTLIDQDVSIAASKDFKFYPNPITRNKSALETTKGLQSFKLYNLLGASIYQQQFMYGDLNQIIQLPDMASGIYIGLFTLQTGEVVKGKVVVE